ncbi:Hypothetical protein NGAL_HAMBI2427_12660 [Neorhizobium galegae bv. orientalis]|nr:Hypothetical protein NGAL_HAMBI2427_12660 [Neorhizobium galegae bv. orientalis]
MGDVRLWRTYAAKVASYLHTPLPTVLKFHWDELLRWHEEARAIHLETFGLLLGMRELPK